MDKEILTLEQIAPYLPYGLQMKGNGFTGKLLILNAINGEFKVSCSDWWEDLKDNKYKPLLRPLSQLTQEIEHNGERFVPIEWFEIGYDSNFSIDFDSGNVKLISWMADISKHNIHYDIQCLPFAVVQKLIEWHFDIHGLIDKNLAIPLI